MFCSSKRLIARIALSERSSKHNISISALWWNDEFIETFVFLVFWHRIHQAIAFLLSRHRTFILKAFTVTYSRCWVYIFKTLPPLYLLQTSPRLRAFKSSLFFLNIYVFLPGTQVFKSCGCFVHWFSHS